MMSFAICLLAANAHLEAGELYRFKLSGDRAAGNLMNFASVASLQATGVSGRSALPSTSLNTSQSTGGTLALTTSTLSVSPPRLVFDYRVGSKVTFSGDLDVSGVSRVSNPDRLSFSASVQQGSDWLWFVNPTATETAPAVLRLFGKTDGLSAGIHDGMVAVTSPGAPGDTVTMPVTLNLRTPPTFILRPDTLSFSYQSGYRGGQPPTQTLTVLGDSTPFNVGTSTDSTTATAWLQVNPLSGTTPADLTVSVNPAGLAPGTYQGLIRIISPDRSAAGDGVYTVTLTVTADLSPIVSSTPITLQAQYGARALVSKVVPIYTNGTMFPVAISTSGQPWLSTQILNGWAGTFDANLVQVLPTPATVQVSADPSGLAVGTYSGFISISAPGSTAPPASVPVNLSVYPNDLMIPQIVDGAGWSTSILLVNTDAEAAPFTLKFWQPDGTPLPVTLEGAGSVSEFSDTIPVGGIRVLKTAGPDWAVAQGWAEIIAARSIGGAEIFSQTSMNGNSEASVPIAPTLGRRFLLPFDDTIGFYTGLALVNPGPAPSTVAVAIRDENGDSIVSGSVVLPAHGQKALMLREAFPDVHDHRGVAEFVSTDADLAAIGLRFNPGGTFTSFEPIVPETAGGGHTVTRTVQQIADGNGWKTTVVLANPGSNATPFSVIFHQPDGSSLSLPLAGAGPRTEYEDVIQGGGMRVIESTGDSASQSDGWAEIVSSGSVAGTVVFGQQAGGGSASEGTVQLKPPLGAHLVLPFDNTLGYQTALALLNEGRDLSATIVVRDENGARLSTVVVPLTGHSRQAFFLSDRFPQTIGIRGTIEFQDEGLSILAMRFNPWGSFTSIAPIAK